MQTTRSALAAVGVLSVIGLAHMGSAISATSAEDRARMAAEEMAQAASKEFNAFETRLRVAQADTTKPGKTGAAPQPGGPWQWLQESRERFQALMRRLAGEQSTTQPWDPVADAGRKAATETVAKTAETKKVEVPSVPAAAKPGHVAGAKPPAEERKLAEARRAEADKRDAEASKGKAPAKPDAAKSAEAPKAVDTKSKAADAKPAAEPAKPPAAKTAEAPRGPAKEVPAKAPEAPRIGAVETKKADAPKPAEPPPGGTQSAKQDAAAAKMPEAGPRVTSAPPPASRPPAKPEAAPPKAAAPAAAPAAKPEAPAKAAETPKAGAPIAKQEPPAKQAEPAKQPSAGDKVAANEPPTAKTDMPTGIPTETKARPRSKAKGRPQVRAAAACRAAGRRVSGGNWYTVREGDSLWRIARRHLGEGESYRMLRAANRRSIADADNIRPCQRIYIPRRR